MSETSKPDANVRISYTNHRGETAVRNIRPVRIWFGGTEWHSEQQWFLLALDTDKEAYRDFAIKDIKAWGIDNGN